MLSQEEKESIENQIFKAVENGRKVWADFEVTKEKKDFMVEFAKSKGFSIEVETCPRKIWTVIIKF
jgi:hypothetical protein